MPVGAYIIATEPLPLALLDRLTPNRRNTTDTRNFVNYFRVSPDNRLLFGGRARFSALTVACRICRRSMASNRYRSIPNPRRSHHGTSNLRAACLRACSPARMSHYMLTISIR